MNSTYLAHILQVQPNTKKEKTIEKKNIQISDHKKGSS